MSLLFNMLSSLVIAFLPRSRHLLISWLQSSSALILEPKKIKSVTVSTFSQFVCHEVMGLDGMIIVFCMLNFNPAFSLSLGDSLVPLDFLPLEWYHLHIWGCWYFSQQCWFQLVIHPALNFTWCTTFHISEICRVMIYSLNALFSQFGTSLLFHVWL